MRNIFVLLLQEKFSCFILIFRRQKSASVMSCRTGSKIDTKMIEYPVLTTEHADHGDPKSFTSVQQVCDFLTAIIFNCSCQHAAVDFSQLDMYGFPPHSPTLMRQPLPTKKKQHTESEVMKCLPTKDQAEEAISIVCDLTRIFPDEVSISQKNYGLKRAFVCKYWYVLKYTTCIPLSIFVKIVR